MATPRWWLRATPTGTNGAIIPKKNVGFHWGSDQANAFATLKERLCSTPVLALLDFNKSFEIECDASGIRIGAVLMQDWLPIAFFREN
jgi:hypothetical protein